MSAYYNEIDPYAAQWLRNLIAARHIAPGDVDERSIVDVRPDDLAGYTQAHFFAGIGGWSLALRLAGWPDDRPVWTGSCPCQPFSAAGAGKAADDERHLWPAWFPLIRELRPAIVFGEQVEAAIGWGWLDAVFADLEGESYACGAAVLPACGVGAPHIRARTWFVADHQGERWGEGRPSKAQRWAPIEPVGYRDDRIALGTSSIERREGQQAPAEQTGRRVAAHNGDVELTNGHGWAPRRAAAASNGHGHSAIATGRDYSAMGDAGRKRLQERGRIAGILGPEDVPQSGEGTIGASTSTDAWVNLDWLPCTDGKARPVEPGTFPLAHGIPGRVGRLRAYGNAIVPQVAAEFIKAASFGE